MPMLERLGKPLVYYADKKLEDGSDGENGLGVSCSNGENEGAGDSGRDGGKWGKDGRQRIMMRMMKTSRRVKTMV
jgi:hypothetical protein